MSKAYRQWVASLPCACCGLEGATQAAHYQGLRSHFYGRGKGIKANDLYLAPLCISCHNDFDNYDCSEMETRTMRQIDHSEQFQHMILKTIAEAKRQGVEVG